MILIILLFLQFNINILRFAPILDCDVKTARTSIRRLHLRQRLRYLNIYMERNRITQLRRVFIFLKLVSNSKLMINLRLVVCLVLEKVDRV